MGQASGTAVSLQSSLSILLNPAERSLISLKEILPNNLNQEVSASYRILPGRQRGCTLV